MGKKLIITEKPSVARDFARVLNVNGKKDGAIENGEYVITWCYGHLVEMVYPECYDIRYKKWKLEDLPFLPENYRYGVIESSKDQYKIVNALLHRDDIDIVYWAGDSGKEGQTIEENIRRYGGVRTGMTELRVWIDSQTDEEILRGIREAKPMSEYDRLGKSGIMRTIEDYSLGINFSRALSVKYGRILNDAAVTDSYTAIAIGRVMTCVLGMVVNREREIRNFIETPFYRIVGSFSDISFHGEWKSGEGSRYFQSPLLYKENGFKKRETAEEFISDLTGKTARVLKAEEGISKKKPPFLFNLAELQAECTKQFKLSPKDTLQVAQELYEKKLTTYPRTDARVLTKAVAKEIKKNLTGVLRYEKTAEFTKEILDGNKFAGLEKTPYVDDSKVTDHYAIIPTGEVNALKGLNQTALAVYDLIVRRFLSIFYPPAQYANLKIDLEIEKEQFHTSVKALKVPGYLSVVGMKPEKKTEEGDKEEEEETCSKEDLLKLAKTMKAGDEISVNGFEIKEGKTTPPKRYTSGNLILAMENAGNLIEDEELREQIKNSGIGTSATRGDILEKLVRIKYLHQDKKTQIISPENLGEMVYEVVNLSVPTLLNPEMTASWERGLEGIINGSVDVAEYRKKLEDFIRRETEKMIQTDLTGEIAKNINPFIGKNAKGVAARRPLGIPCPDCGGELTTTGFGYGCSNYFDKEKKCKFSVGEIAGFQLEEEDFRELIANGKTKVLSGFTSKTKKKFKASLVLTKKEDGSHGVAFDFTDVQPDYLEGAVCPDCGGRLLSRSGFYVCENNNQENPDSCKFFIGKIAGKELSEAQAIELLTNGKTGTIRGFKSKSGKKFDAVLELTKNEDGKTAVGFDFDNVEAQVVKGLKCPMCGGDIEKSTYGYRCSNYDSKKEDACKFSVGTLAGVKLTDAQMKELINHKITGVISGFKSKNGKKFDARIALDEGEDGKLKGVKFVFENDAVEELEGIACPKCGKKIVYTRGSYRCEDFAFKGEGCSFMLGKMCGVEVDREQFYKLVKEGHTDKIAGFKSKKGSNFDASLKLDEEKKVVFDFN